jgi:hypothetical protein
MFEQMMLQSWLILTLPFLEITLQTMTLATFWNHFTAYYFRWFSVGFRSVGFECLVGIIVSRWKNDVMLCQEWSCRQFWTLAAF